MANLTANQTQLPHNIEAERAILGSILLDNNALRIAIVELNLTPADFYSAAHRLVIEAMIEMARKDHIIDIITLCDHLNASGLLDKAGGAGHLSALTDGVPIGAISAVREYCRIVKEKSDKRITLKAAFDLAQTAVNGCPPEQVAEAAEKLAARARPTKSSHSTKDKYPLVPQAAWHAAAELYLRAIGESTEASNNYHLASFLSVIGALFGRTIYVRKGRITYPNLFTILVGRSGARKGTAINLALDLMTSIDPNVYVLDSIDSKESCVKEMADHQQELYQKGWTHEHREILAMEEFGMLLEKSGQKGTRNIMPFLCTTYDCPPRAANKAFSSKAELKNPTMSVLSCTSESYLEPLTIRDIKGGAGNRVCWVGGDPKPRKDDPPDPDQDSLNALTALVRDRMDFYRRKGATRFELSESATKRHRQFYLTEYNPPTGDEMLEVLGERDAQTVLKVATIYAALDHADRYVELHHLESAIAYVSYLYATRIPIFSGHGLSYASAAQKRIIEIVQREGAIYLARLQPLMQRHCDATLLDKYLRSLSYPGGPIKTTVQGRKTLITKGDD